MAKQFPSSFGETNYPGKRAELAAEKAEKEEHLDITSESSSDYNKIRTRLEKSPLNKENDYNSLEAEETTFKPGRTFITSEDVVDEDQNENSIIEAIDLKMKTEEASLAVIDSYGYSELIEKIFLSAQEKGNIKEMDLLLNRASRFIKQYQELLKEGLPDDEEKTEVEELFKETLGEVVHIKDGDSERLEILPNFKNVRNAQPGQDKGKRIFYASNDRTGRGYLSQKEADQAVDHKTDKSKINKDYLHNNKKASVFSGLAQELKAFNPFTGKKESINKRRVN